MYRLINLVSLLQGAAAVQAASGNAPSAFQTQECYPSPPMANPGGSEQALNDTNAFLTQLTLVEKVSLIEGSDGPCGGNIAPIPRVGFKGLCLQDSPLGVREADFVTMFPAGISAGASFDKKLIHQRGLLMADEFRSKGVNIALSPVVGPLGRHPDGGRNWEGFGADPYLAGIAAAETISGFNAQGVQTTIKHWIGNEQETMRNPTTLADGTVLQESLSSNIDDRTLHELYMWPFSDAVRAGVSHAMCSYQRLNQTYACENSKALNGLLKGELGFQGAVMSDWFATKSGVPAIKAGLDLNMPGSPTSPYFQNITDDVRSGNLAEDRIDDMVRRVLTPYFRFKQNSTTDYPSLDPSINENKARSGIAIFKAVAADQLNLWNVAEPKSRDVRKKHKELVRRLGAAGAVLLKNTGALPLKEPQNIAVIGNDAADLTRGQIALDPTDPIGPEFGANAIGGGSGSGHFHSFVSPLEAIKTRMGNGLTQYILDNKVAAEGIRSIYPPPEACLVFVKSYTSEASDRVNLDLQWNGTTMIDAVSQSCNNTIVVSHTGGANLMPWADNPNVTAIIAGHMPGQEIGNSIVDILWGDVNPSGKLPYTIAHRESDYSTPIVNATGTTDLNAWQADFTEGLLIDYRHFDAFNITPRYAFGFGLSYTTFELGSLSVTKPKKQVASLPSPGAGPGGNPALFETLLKIQVTISNTGQLSGATVSQLYLSFPDSAPVGTPVQVLRGFDKTEVLSPGQSQDLYFELTRKDMSFWDVNAQNWRIPNGAFAVKVGFSSRDIQAQSSVVVT